MYCRADDIQRTEAMSVKLCKKEFVNAGPRLDSMPLHLVELTTLQCGLLVDLSSRGINCQSEHGYISIWSECTNRLRATQDRTIDFSDTTG